MKHPDKTQNYFSESKLQQERKEAPKTTGHQSLLSYGIS